METIFEAKISVKHISEKRLMEFMRTLIAKYILEPEEILDEYRTIPFRKKRNMSTSPAPMKKWRIKC